MKNIVQQLTCLFLISVLLAGCKTSYQPPVISSPNSFLVIEGVINSSNISTDSTLIKLSRTINLAAGNKPNPVLHATVSVEDGQGYVFALKEAGKGKYIAGPMGLDSKKKYRLRITADNRVYLSDLVPITYTPPIDSIGYTILNKQVMIYVNTHNPSNSTRNYRWDFIENWKFQSPLISQFRTNGSSIVPRTPEYALPYYCWGVDTSANVLLASSKKLISDEIYQTPIAYINSTSDKLDLRYSINLKQYSLTDEAFIFWSELKRNTEQLGTIFDAQPSQNNGNIHCITDAGEAVLGYLSITNIQTKRVYINRNNIAIPYVSDFVAGCLAGIKEVWNADESATGAPQGETVQLLLIPISSSYIPIGFLNATFINPITHTPVSALGYDAVTLKCLDCSLRGSTKPPLFWKDN